MSASSKKKLRKEQNAAQMTEKQRQQQAEARKLKTYTIVFVTAMILVVAIALSVVGYRAVNQSGIIQKNTLAATVDGHELNSVELNYFYVDAINNLYNQWYSQYSTYTDTYVKMLYKLDTTAPLNAQTQDEETGATWADYFVEMAIEDAKASYALYNKAVSERYELSEDDRAELESAHKTNSEMATLYGYKKVDDYLEAMYGYGSDEESYNEYLELTMVAYAFSRDYSEALEYDDAAIREYEKDHYNDFSSYSYASYYMTYTSFLEGGTEGEDGKTTYSDAEKDAARAKLKETAEALAKATSVEELDKMIGELEINKDSETTVASTKYERKLYSTLNGDVIAKWLSEEGRKAGDIGAVVSTTTTDNGDGTSTTTEDGYYVVLLQSIDLNTAYMGNVRHLLVQFEGGTKDDDGNTVYSDAEKAVAKSEAEGHLTTWKEGAATEDSFIELVKEHSDDSSKSTGGLFEDINADSNYVENFLNWSIDPERQKGDTEVIETEFGYHVMYYVGNSELTYRDYMISETLREADYTEWYEAVLEPVTATEGNTSKLDLDRIISYGS